MPELLGSETPRLLVTTLRLRVVWCRTSEAMPVQSIWYGLIYVFIYDVTMHTFLVELAQSSAI
jgi:hypothetical protein